MLGTATLNGALRAAADKTKAVLVTQIELGVHSLGARCSETAGELEAVGSQLRQSRSIAGAAQVTDWASAAVERAGQYLQTGSAQQFLTDLEALGRRRPWTFTAAAAGLGFASARLLRSASARRWRFKPEE